MSGPFSRVIDAVVSIATNLGGTITHPTGNRIADALEVIADKAVNVVHVTVTNNSGTLSLDKTWKEISEADFAPATFFPGGSAPTFRGFISGTLYSSPYYYAYFVYTQTVESGSATMTTVPLKTDSETGYPTTA